MVLAAGLGTRLRPLTDVRAKALVPVGDRPVLAHVLDRLGNAAIGRIVVNAHHRRSELRDFILARQDNVAVSEEEELLGTAGGVARASELLGPTGDVLAWNADTLTEIDPRAVIAAHRGGAAEATLVVQPGVRGSGSVGLDATGRIVRLRDRRIADETRGGEFLGIHVLGSALRQRLPARGCLVGDVYIPLLERGGMLHALAHEAPFFDVGSLQSYLDANIAWLAARGIFHWMGPGVQVTPGVQLQQSVLGRGASVSGSGTLSRCVVWPGAVAVAPLDRAVVAPGLIARVTY